MSRPRCRLRRLGACTGLALALFLSLAPRAARAVDAPLREDRIRFVVHELIKNQLTAAQLQGYLDTVHELLHGSQNAAIDVPTCTDFGTVTDGGTPPVLFSSGTGLADGLAVIENESELTQVLDWADTQGDRVGVFVQDIQWCGAPGNIVGCAPAPGTSFVVALDAAVNIRGMVIAHERGHNAGLLHRTTDACALMYPSAGSTHGCLDQAEAKAFYNKADVATGDTCECIDVKFMGPNQTWSLNPQGTTCDDSDACTLSTTCDVGLCEAGSALDCSDGNLCTSDLCDPVTGCVNPNLPNGALCLDPDSCNGFEACLDGVCQPGVPVVCDDGQFCNGLETCDPALLCQPGTPPPLDDGVGCTDDSCDEVGDVVVHAVNHGLCDDGQFCDGTEVCDALADCGPGTPPPLDDGVACTDDSCDEGADLVVHAPNPLLCDDADPCTAELCDEVAGCLNEPILECPAGIPVPASRAWGRGLLATLLVAAGAGATRARRH